MISKKLEVVKARPQLDEEMFKKQIQYNWFLDRRLDCMPKPFSGANFNRPFQGASLSRNTATNKLMLPFAIGWLVYFASFLSLYCCSSLSGCIIVKEHGNKQAYVTICNWLASIFCIFSFFILLFVPFRVHHCQGTRQQTSLCYHLQLAG